VSEQIGVVLVFGGLAAMIAGACWLVYRGVGALWRRRDVRRLVAPSLLLAGGLVVGVVPFAYQHLYLAIVGLGERERVIDGERYLNLTGWDREGYGILTQRPDVAVLEMGNPDVTDATLVLLADLPRLRELTLNDAAVTDAGLATLARLSALETLRLSRTQVTPEGLRAFLATPPPRLVQLDVSGLGIPAQVLRDWRNADPEGKRRYVN
jgi:hypothetical protein